MGESIDSSQAVIHGIIALASAGRYAAQAFHLLLKGWLRQLQALSLTPHHSPVTSWRKYRKKRSFESASVCVCATACMVVRTAKRLGSED